MTIGLFYNVESTNWGPGKIAHNLRLGLDKLGVEYKVNEKQEFNILLHGGGKAMSGFLEQDIDPKKSLIGPCVEGSLGDYPQLHKIFPNYLASSPWHKRLYEKQFPERSKGKRIFYWPCGIDTDFYKPFERATKYNDYVHYDKHTTSEFHYWIRGLMESFDQKMSYALCNSNYENIGLKVNCDSSKYCVSTCGSETQGFGNMEVLSMDLPIFGLDKNYHFAFSKINSKIESTSFPYFSNECGMILHMKDYLVDYENLIKDIEPPCAEPIDWTRIEDFLNVEYIKEKFSEFLDQKESYSPRKYILENHTLEKGAQKLVDMFTQL